MTLDYSQGCLQKKIAYNETFAYLGGRGSKKIPIILHLINGTFIMGGRGSEFFVSCLILEKTTQKGEVVVAEPSNY